MTTAQIVRTTTDYSKARDWARSLTGLGRIVTIHTHRRFLRRTVYTVRG